MQEYIAEDQRGILNSTQTATYQLFYVLIQCAGIVLNKPQEFIVLVTFSIVVVLCACLCYTRWYGKIGAKHARERRRAEGGGNVGGSNSASTLVRSLLRPGGESKRGRSESEVQLTRSESSSPVPFPGPEEGGFKEVDYEHEQL